MESLSLDGVDSFYAWLSAWHREGSEFRMLFLHNIKRNMPDYTPQHQLMAKLFVEYTESIGYG